MFDQIVLGMPIVSTPLLSGPNEFFLFNGRTFVGSAGAIRWILMACFAQGWPIRDVAASAEDG